jgi:AraC family transcriptional regulator
MSTEFQHLLTAIAALADPARSVALADAAALAGLSPSRAQRVITEAIGESPKCYQRRTRLELGAILLMATDARVIDVAVASGFANHETFTRSFVDRFGERPIDWRRRRPNTLTPTSAQVAASTSRCLTLYRRALGTTPGKAMTMDHEITTQTTDAMPVLFQSHRVDRDDVGGVLAQCLPAVFGYVMEQGLAPAGHPFVRYRSFGAAMVEIDAGIPLVEAPAAAPPEDSGIVQGELPASLVATTTHRGPYEGLGDAYRDLERWIEASAYEPAGAPWEVYLTDPGEVPDPADWLTAVSWPIAER